MDALSFRNALREAKPTVESLAGIGIGKDETTEITASFDLRDRATEQGNNLSDSTLHDFFRTMMPVALRWEWSASVTSLSQRHTVTS